jgi:hypothetical protein
MISLIRVANPHNFNADSDPAFHFKAAPDPNPAPDQGDANLRGTGTVGTIKGVAQYEEMEVESRRKG